MLVIRLRRVGRHKDPHYRIVVTEHTAPIQGKFLTEIGHYHPKSKELVIDEAKMTDWMNKGAKPSNTVARLAQKAKISHKQVVVKQLTGSPKKKAQAALDAKNTPKEVKSVEPIIEETTPESDAPELTEEVADEPTAESETTAEASEVAPEITEEPAKEE